MNDEVRKIKCPVCGAVLSVKYAPNIEHMNVTCPVCKSTNKYMAYKVPFQQKPVSEETDKMDILGEETMTMVIGFLRQLSNGKSYKLKEGSNLIGRKASTSPATIQIETADMYMSRSHAEIVVERSSTGMIHYFQNSKNKNDTYVNGQKVNHGDCLILNGGEVIKMAETELKFELDNGNKNKNHYSDYEEATTL